MGRRVVVTGMGMVTPLGRDMDSTWAALLRGDNGVGPITLFDSSAFPTRIAAEVKGFQLADYLPDAERWQRCNRNNRFAIAAAKMAVDHSRLLEGAGPDPARFGIYLGSGEGQQDFPRFMALLNESAVEGSGGGPHVDSATFTSQGPSRLDQWHEAEQDPGTTTGHLASIFGARGVNANCLTACAASAQAMGEAVEQIRRGDAEVMLTGGTHSMIHAFGVTGFNLLTALSTRNEPGSSSRPFDLNRDGFVLGEGAAMLVLEELEHAKRRGATIHGEVIGYASTADAFRITDSHETGRGAIACIKEALQDAGISPQDIDYINAHGTGTQVNDSIETLAIKQALGEAAYKIPVSSTKSMMGHLIAAAGATEAIICMLAIRDGMVPPTINLETPDPDCDLDYIPHKARRHDVDIALSNSFGFGGQNTALVIRRFVA